MNLSELQNKDLINIIDGKKIIAEEGSTILNVATQNGIKIPNLCYDGRVDLYGDPSH